MIMNEDVQTMRSNDTLHAEKQNVKKFKKDVSIVDEERAAKINKHWQKRYRI